LNALEAGQTGVVATVVRHRASSPGKEQHKMLVLRDGTTHGTIGGGTMEATVLKHCADVFREGRGKVVEILLAEEEKGGVGSVCGGSADVALELLPRLPRILICGGGHCAVEIARLTAQLEYLYEVHEDRVDYATEERFPHALQIHHGAPEDLAMVVGDLDRFTHVALVSRGFSTDRVYGRALSEAGYEGWVGMLASQKKARKTRKTWEEDGVDPAFIERLEAPVGLPIGARSPAEVALSIMARVVETFRG
jgi:xanthine dehydrogenase accessory factor